MLSDLRIFSVEIFDLHYFLSQVLGNEMAIIYISITMMENV